MTSDARNTERRCYPPRAVHDLRSDIQSIATGIYNALMKLNDPLAAQPKYTAVEAIEATQRFVNSEQILEALTSLIGYKTPIKMAPVEYFEKTQHGTTYVTTKIRFYAEEPKDFPIRLQAGKYVGEIYDHHCFMADSNTVTMVRVEDGVLKNVAVQTVTRRHHTDPAPELPEGSFEDIADRAGWLYDFYTYH